MTALATVSVSRFIGCDVGKNTIAVFDSRNSQTRILPNHPQDLTAFAAELDHSCFVVCEATGGYEAELLAALSQAGRTAHRADARKVKAFIRSFGVLGKTDAIDAYWLARYGRERHAQLTAWVPPDEQRRQIQALVMTRADLVVQRVAWKNRLSGPNAGAAKPYIQNMLRCCNEQIKAIDAAIQDLVKHNQTIQSDVKTLQTIGGIGPKIAPALLALMPELGSINRQKAAAIAGLAPHPKQSGAKDAPRHVKGGRPQIKRVLFMAALVASRHDPKLKAFYQSLIAKGKKPIVAITALMRKIITIANARLRDKNSFQVS